MLPELAFRVERWPLATPFRISRGTKTEAVVVVVEARAGEHIGRGECVPYARYGETAESVLARLEALAAQFDGTLTREELQRLLPPGAARNALDCALWDLEARQSGRSVSELLGGSALDELTTALTVSLDEPHAMEAAARSLAGAPVIKIKVDANRPEAAIEAVARAAPHARLIVDPNESWSFGLLERLQPFLKGIGIALVEQPLPAAEDRVLEGFKPQVPLCADESVHVSADLGRVVTRYQFVNIKLDKTGGLTEALNLLNGARARGLGVMVGCMVCTSLGIAPALQVAAHADFADLDGPWWLAKDREGGLRIELGRIHPPSRALWGG
jgi:L-alanine-DL-glutamate epimerase-like enolase superfamily enzyme